MRLQKSWILAVALLFVTGMLGCSTDQDAQQEAAIAEIEELGGSVTVGKPVVEVSLECTEVTDAELEHLKGLTSLQSLHLSGTQVTDEGVKKLQQALSKCKIEH